MEIPLNWFAAKNLEFVCTFGHKRGELLAQNAFQVVCLLHGDGDTNAVYRWLYQNTLLLGARHHHWR